MRTYERNLNAEWHVSSDGQPRRHSWLLEVTTSAVVEFDGGARPNLQGAIGYIVEAEDWIEEGGEFPDGGETTNIEAEYKPLIRGLEMTHEKGFTVVKAKGDLELVVKQIRGEYGVSEQSLYPLHERAQELAEEFERFEIQRVPREENRAADQLVEKAFGN